MIKEFQGEYRWLSNFWPAKVKFRHIEFPTVENAYQAAKCQDWNDLKKFINIKPGESKKLGRTIAIRQDWEESKLLVMERLLLQKFPYDDDNTLTQKLIATYPKEIQEGNLWHDTFWGINLRTGKGQNHLGKLIMRIREDIARWRFAKDGI